jgi:hypothetical protein
MHTTLKYLVFIAACGLVAGFTTVQSVSDIRGASAAAMLADDKSSPNFVTKIPPGYRDWKLISVAHEEGNLNSFAAVLGNDLAIRAYREGKLPFPDGAIIAALQQPPGLLGIQPTWRRRFRPMFRGPLRWAALRRPASRQMKNTPGINSLTFTKTGWATPSR